MTNFSSRLKEERQRLQMNQTTFASLGGVTKDTQLNYENGSRRPDSAYLEAIASHGVDVLYLLTGERNTAALSTDEIDLIRRYRQAPRALRAAALGALAAGVAAAVPQSAGTSIKVQGDVGQYLEGDSNAPVTIDMSKGRKRRS